MHYNSTQPELLDSEYLLSDLKWNVRLLKEWQKKLIVDTPYQRQFVWNRGIQQRLIWCMLRGQDVPKFYFHARRDNDENLWDIVDGKQRITTIWSFLDDKFPLSRDAKPIKGMEVSGLRYSQLPLILQRDLNNYKLDIKEIVTDEISRVQDQFIDLQRGKPLTSQEKRQAANTFPKVFIQTLGEHPFMPIAQLTKTRFANYETLSRLVVWEMEGQIADTSANTIDKLYLSYANDTWETGNWNVMYGRMIKVLDALKSIFNSDYEILRRVFPFMVTYWLVRTLVFYYVLPDGWQVRFLEWWFRFWESQSALEKKKEIRQWSSGTAAGSANRERYQIYQSSFFENFPDVLPKDAKRVFDENERRLLFLRAKGRCQWVDENGDICNIELSSGDWDADHIIRHCDGGATHVDNGRLLCKWQNRANGNTDFVCPLRSGNEAT